MLARLEQESGVELAEVDRRGEVLRVRVSEPDEMTRVIDLLQELGFLGELVPASSINIPRWYGATRVSELSREEADVIAERVVPAFARENGIDASEVDALRALAANAMHECFIQNALDASGSVGVLHGSCGRAVESASRPRLGPDRAASLGRAIEADLAARSAFRD